MLKSIPIIHVIAMSKTRSDMLPLWTDAYLADTMQLNNEQHGCYLKLLIFAWRQPDCRIKDCNLILKNVLGVTPKKLSTLKPVLMSFWDLKDGYYSQKRLTREHKKRRAYIDEQKSKSQKSRDNANFEYEKSSETFPKKANENNDSKRVAEAVAVADVSLTSSLSADGPIDWMGVRAICLKAADGLMHPETEAFIDIADIKRLVLDAKHPCDLQEDILPAIREAAARPSTPRNMKSWKYFIPIAIQKRDERLTELPAPKERKSNDKRYTSSKDKQAVSRDRRRESRAELLESRKTSRVAS